MDRIDILFLIRDANAKGGTEILTFNLAKSMKKYGMNAIVLSIVPYTGEKTEFKLFSIDLGIYFKYRKIQNKSLDRFLFHKVSNLLLKRYLKTELDRYRPQLFVCQEFFLLTTLPINKFKNSINFVQILNWSVKGYKDALINHIRKKNKLRYLFSRFYLEVQYFFNSMVLSRLGCVVTLTDAAEKEILFLNKKLDKNIIRKIPNPLLYTKDSLCLSSLDNKNIIFVGRLSHEKGVIRLLSIWEQMSNTLPDYTLTIYGEGILYDEMQNIINDRNIRNIIFKGFVRELENIYLTADLLLMTSDTEGFGQVLTEAMYFGVPSISFDVPISPKELIGNAGIIIECFNENEYVNSAVKILKDKNILHDYQQKGVLRARDFYIDKVISNWKALI